MRCDSGDWVDEHGIEQSGATQLSWKTEVGAERRSAKKSLSLSCLSDERRERREEERREERDRRGRRRQRVQVAGVHQQQQQQARQAQAVLRGRGRWLRPDHRYRLITQGRYGEGTGEAVCAVWSSGPDANCCKYLPGTPSLHGGDRYGSLT